MNNVVINNALVVYAGTLEEDNKQLKERVETLEVAVDVDVNLKQIKSLTDELNNKEATCKDLASKVKTLEAKLRSSNEMIRQARDERDSAKAEAVHEVSIRARVSNELAESKVTVEQLMSELVKHGNTLRDMSDQQVQDSQTLIEMRGLLVEMFDYLKNQTFTSKDVKVAEFRTKVDSLTNNEILGDDLDTFKKFMFDNKDNGRGMNGIVDIIVRDEECAFYKYFGGITLKSARNKLSRYARALFGSTDVKSWTM